jgi:hypothetical protein
MVKISESEFAGICRGVHEDRASILKHNPVGTPAETLLWMVLSVLSVYLSLSEIESPCFNGKPTADTYRDAILFVLSRRKTSDFDARVYLDKLVEADALNL